MDCIFCKIINNEIPSYTIYEDEIVKVFLDIEPNTNGHLLLIPKKHISNIREMDDKTWNTILITIKKMYQVLEEKLGCKGLTITENNDYGQEVKHFHFHLMPRYIDDEVDKENKTIKLLPVEEVYNILTK